MKTHRDSARLLLAVGAMAAAACTLTPDPDAVAVPTLPVIQAFTATPSETGSYVPVTLSWSVDQADSISIDQGIGAVADDSLKVNTGATTVYTLTATNAVGAVTAQTTVTVAGLLCEGVTYPVSSGDSLPGAVAIGDFDGDGTLDLAVGNTSTNVNTISILLNDADGGGEGTFPVYTEYTSTGGHPSVAVADFDGDDALDLAVSNTERQTANVFLGDGDGAFAAQTDNAAVSGVFGLAIADFDRDGWPDLAVTSAFTTSVYGLMGSISVMRNAASGDGTLEASVSYISGGATHSVAAADFDGDGWVDLAVANYSVATVSIFRNRAAGTVSFDTRVDFTVHGSPSSVVAGDFDGDGWTDLAFAEGAQNAVGVLLNQGAGSIAFDAVVDYATGTNAYAVATADLNGDGVLDLVVANAGSNTLSVLLGVGDGTFRDQVAYATGAYPSSIAAGDVDGDGYDDVVVTNQTDSTVSIFTGWCLP